MTDSTSILDDTPLPDSVSPLPDDVEHVSAYAWRRGAVEMIAFHGAAQLTTAVGPLTLEAGTWLLARWDGPSLADIPDGELLCVLPETTPDSGSEGAS